MNENICKRKMGKKIALLIYYMNDLIYSYLRTFYTH